MEPTVLKCLVCHVRFRPESLAWHVEGTWWEILCGNCMTRQRISLAANPERSEGAAEGEW